MDSLVARLLVCRCTHQIRPELIDEILAALRGATPAADARAVRDGYLREAARLLPGSNWQRAEAMADLIRRFRAPADEMRRLLWLAERSAPLPSSVRQIHRIISSY